MSFLALGNYHLGCIHASNWRGVTLYDPDTVENALQQSLQGRVPLREDLTSGVDVKVGTDPSGTTSGESGVYLFIDTGTDVTLVEPDSHDEEAVIVAPDIDDIHLELTEAAMGEYTTAAGAYIRPTTLPTAVAALKIVDTDPMLHLMDPAYLSEVLPGAYIQDVGADHDGGPSPQYDYEYTFLIRYARLVAPGESTRTHRQNAAQLVNMVHEDPHLGGRVDWVDVDRVSNVDPQGNPNRVQLSDALWMTWTDIRVSAGLEKTWTKFT